MKNKDYLGDTRTVVEKSPLVEVSRDLLMNVIESTSMLNKKTMDADGIREARVVLGYLNAANAAIQTRQSYYKMADTKEKIQAVKDRG